MAASEGTLPMSDTSRPLADLDKNRVVIFDTTLRDGEQSPGASMNLDEKIKIALLLEEMGVDVIEAGFPIASNGDFEAVREIAGLVENSTVCGLARAGRMDIDRARRAPLSASQARSMSILPARARPDGHRSRLGGAQGSAPGAHPH